MSYRSIDQFAEAETSLGFRHFYPHLVRGLKNLIVVPGVAPAVLRTVAETLEGRVPMTRWHHAHHAEKLTGLCFPQHHTAVLDEGVYQRTLPVLDTTSVHWMPRTDPVDVPLHDINGHLILARRLLEAAQTFRDAYEYLLHTHHAIPEESCTHLRQELVESLLAGVGSDKVGRSNHYFGSVLTADGPAHFLQSILGQVSHRIALTGPSITAKTSLIRRVGEIALTQGFDVQFYHCGLHPSRIDHIVVPERQFAITNAEPPHLLPYLPTDRVVAFSPAPMDLPRQLVEQLWASYQSAYHTAWQEMQDMEDEIPEAPLSRSLLASLLSRVESLLELTLLG